MVNSLSFLRQNKNMENKEMLDQKIDQKRFNCETPNWLEVQRSQRSFPIGGRGLLFTSSFNR
jgi:hypothetical protein